MTADSNRKVSDADRAGFVARSPEGHAARSMSIKGQEEVWIQIQANTFKNWVNVNLAEAGVRPIQSFQSDFSDGTVLVALVEKLQKRRLRHNQKPHNQHHELENISIALDAIQEDGIKLVNIGNTDINNGNLKLILGLIWSLIAHYQLGASNFPPKKLMLSWLKAVLPDCNIKNFTNDWNNGIYLSALLDYCQPGLIPHWRKLNPNNGPENCKRAMELAQRSFNIPSVLEPEYLASPHLDELSGMTYLSYFMKEEDSPGYYATLDWVKSQIPTQRINNFRTDWNDGLAAAALVKAKGGPVPGFHDMDNHPENWVSNLEVSLKGGKKVGVTPVMDARDMASPNVEYLGVMSWVAQFQWINDRVAPGDRLEIQCTTNKVRQDEEVHFKLDVLDKDFHQESITAEVIGPSGPIYMDFDMDPSGGRGFFKPDEMGMHELLVKNEGEPIRGAPHFMRIMPKSKKDYDGIEPCAVGSTVEVLINPHHAARPDLLAVTAFSPTNRPLGCPVSDDNGTFYASFNPDEAGEWRIHVTYDEEDIEHSPFRCMVFDPRAIFIPDQDAARRAIPGDPFTFTVDASKTGWGEVAIDVAFENRSIRRTFYVEEVAHRIYKVTFTPQARGKHRVYVYLNGMEVKGSPFALRVGKDIKEARKPATDIFRADRKVSRYKTHEESRAERRNYFTEREIPIQAPLAPPRSKKKEFARRQSIKDFRDENRQTLFKSDHQTDEGVDLLPVNKKIAFDCPDNGARAEEIHVDIIGPDGRKCPTEIRSNPNGTFTCQFTTNSVAEYRIEVFIRNERVNVTPTFYTFDASKVHVGHIPSGFVGMPVEFEAEAQRAGFGKMEAIVNHGRVSSHVSSLSKDRKFAASFIPHDIGRHRIDVKFNGEKVPNSPWFIEVKDPNKPLLAPGLVSGKIHVPNGANGFHSETNGREYHSTALRSSDFNKVDTRIEESYYDSSDVIARNRTNDIYTASRKASYAGAAQPSQLKPQKFETANENLPPPTLATSLKSTNTHKMEPTRDFGNFSSLLAPALISGNKTVEEKTTTTTKRTTTTEEFSKASEKNNNNLSYANHNKNDHDSAYYSTTITKPVKEKPGGMEANFLLSDVTKSSGGTFRITDNSTSRDSSPIKRESSPLRSRLIETKREPSPLSSNLRTSKLQTSSSTMASSSSSSLATSSLASKIPKPTNRDQRSLSRTNNNLNSLERRGSGSFHQDYATDNSPGVQKSNYSSSFDTGPVVQTGTDGTKTVTQKSGSTSYTSYSSSSSTANASRSVGLGNQSKAVEHKQNTLSVPGGSSKGTSTSNAGAEPGSTSPKLNSYRGTAEKCKFLGETVRHFNAGKLATFELKAPGHKKEDIEVNIISPEKRPRIPNKIVDEGSSRFRIEFTTVEVGSYVIDVTVSGLTVPNSPLIAKAYDAGLIKVTDIQDGFVGELSTFRVDASKSGEGQLEISINDGDVPNAVQVLGGGKCLVTYTPEQPITHEIEVTFNGEQVTGSPFLCRVTDGDNYSAGGSSGDFSKVEVGLDHLNHIPIKTTSSFTIKVAGGDDAELAVSVQGPSDDIPVKVTGNVKNGFTAEFVPKEVGPHTILVEYNGMAVGGTPFFSKAYSSDHVAVSDIPKSSGGKTVKFAVDAVEAGEGNLEILVKCAADGRSLPTHVHPVGNAVFHVAFTPQITTDHIIHITFNDECISGSPFISHKLSEKNRSANKSTSTDNQGSTNHSRWLEKYRDYREEFNVIVLEDKIVFDDFDDESSTNDDPITVIVTCDDDLASEKDFEQHTISLVETTINRPMTKRLWANIGPPHTSGTPNFWNGNRPDCRDEHITSSSHWRESRQGKANHAIREQSAIGTHGELPSHLKSDSTISGSALESSLHAYQHPRFHYVHPERENAICGDKKKELANGNIGAKASLKLTTSVNRISPEHKGTLKTKEEGKDPPISSQEASSPEQVELLPSQFCSKKTEHFSSSDNKEPSEEREEGFKDHEDHSNEDSCCSLCCSGTVMTSSSVGSTAAPSECNCHQASSELSQAEFPIVERPDLQTHFDGSSSSSSTTSMASKNQMENEFEIFHDEDGGEFAVSATAQESSHKPVTLTSTPIGKPVAFNLLLEGILKELEVEREADHHAPGGSPAGGDPIEKCVISIDGVQTLANEARKTRKLMKVDSGLEKWPGSQSAQSSGLSATTRTSVVKQQVKSYGNGSMTKAILQPQQLTVFDASKVSVSLAENHIGFEADSPFTFHVDPRNAGHGSLEIVVATEDGSVPSQMKREPNGTFRISFLPRDIHQEHAIIISYNGVPISGMPMKIKAIPRGSNSKEDSDIDDCKAAHFHSPASFMASKDEMFAIPNDPLKASKRVQIRSMKSASLPCDSHISCAMKRGSRLSGNHENGVPLKSQTDLFMSAQDPWEDETKIQNCTLDLRQQRQTEQKKWNNSGRFLPPSGSPDNVVVPQSTEICQNIQETREGCTRLTRRQDERCQLIPASPWAEHVIDGELIRVNVTPEKKYNHFSTNQGELVVLVDLDQNSNGLEMRVDIIPSLPSGERPTIKASISPAKDLSLPWESQCCEAQDCQVIPLKCERRNEIFSQRHLSTEKAAQDSDGKEKEDNLRFSVLIPFPENELSSESRLGGVFILEIGFPYANVSRRPETTPATPTTTTSLRQATPFMVFSKEHSIFASRNDDILVLGDGLLRGVVGVEASFCIYLLREHPTNTEGERNLDWNRRLPRVWLKDPQGQLVQVQLLPKRQIGPWQKPQCNPDQGAPRSMLSRVVVEASYCPTMPGNHIMHISWKHCELVGFPKKVGVIKREAEGRPTKATVSHGLGTTASINEYNSTTDGKTISCRIPGQIPLNKFSIVEVHSSNPLASPKSLTATLVPTSAPPGHKSGNNGGGPPTLVVSQGGSSLSSAKSSASPAVVRQTGHRTYHIILHPRTIGEHMVHVFYNHEAVPGSPFPVTVSGPPAGRAAVPSGHNHIRAFGPGLEHGLLHTFHSEFICDARGAGPGHLTVKVRGPKGAFHTEMLSSSGPGRDNRIILCRYNPSEPGDYRIEIKWSGHHIPGSPFFVMIFDTQRELAHFFEYTRETSRDTSRDTSLDFRPVSWRWDPRWENMSMSSFEVMRNCGNIGYLTMYNRTLPSSARLSDRSFVM
ncbi:uncharacterized protein LOC131878933 [Tigriopus californicus]|uniref:uncharacterized protein LOC131878933 n=1 Tax=Tigriopus californicus TaxID=6832 RepID=UPI0027DA3889|nr:uncharacterized protein LOC131878933 [Tigriopus californicus]